MRRLGDAGPVLDAQARSEYRARLVELEAELADAERCADLGRLERASVEREALLAELESSGRGAKPGSDVERARIAVTKAIRTALEKIAEAHPELGAHLAELDPPRPDLRLRARPARSGRVGGLSRAAERPFRGESRL